MILPVGAATASRRRGLSLPGWPGLLDRYLVVLMGPPMIAASAVMLSALLLYKVMEIFYFLSESSGEYGLLFGLIGNLLPHYLGLAIPAAFFISIFLVVARLGDNSEIDALLGSGVSIDRLARPFLLLGVTVGVYSIVLMGYVQPLSRYAYNLVLNQAQAATWDARVQPKAFVVANAELAMTAEAADVTGRRLQRVFVRRRLADGGEQLFTARSAGLYPSPDGARLTAVLEEGREFEDRPGRTPIVGAFDRFALDLGLASVLQKFRLRGAVARELTLDELVAKMARPDAQVSRTKAASEFYTRVVRSISALLLPLLAVPLGMAAKRGRRGPGLAVAALLFLLYEHAIDFGQAMADLGHVSPEAAIWGPFLVFAVICVGLYAGSRQRPGDTPLALVLDGLGDGWRRLRRLLRLPLPRVA